MSGTLIELYGPASSGKTTLAKRFAQKYEAFHLPEAYRLLEGHPAIDVKKAADDPQFAMSQQVILLHHQKANIDDALAEHDFVIADRCLRDFENYSRILLGGEYPAFSSSYERAVDKAYMNMRANSHRTFILDSVGFEDDGVRDARNYAEECRYFDMHKPAYCTSLPVANGDRLKQLEDALWELPPLRK